MTTDKQVAVALLSTLVETPEAFPEGHLYASLMGTIDLETFQLAVIALKAAKLVESQGQYLIKATERARKLPWPADVKVVHCGH